MKKWLLVLGLVAILFSLIARAFLLEFDSLEDEKKWFVKNLNYQFNFVVDSISVYGYDVRGFLIRRIVGGNFDSTIESELANQIKEYKSSIKRNNHRISDDHPFLNSAYFCVPWQNRLGSSI